MKKTVLRPGFRLRRRRAGCDYYKDLLAQSLLEVLPNTFTKGLTDPRGVYLFRWMACKQGGLDFNPLFTIITPSRSTKAPSSMTISDSKRKLS